MKKLSLFMIVMFLFIISACKLETSNQISTTSEAESKEAILTNYDFTCYGSEHCTKGQTTNLFLKEMDYQVKTETTYYLQSERINQEIVISNRPNGSENVTFESAYWNIDYNVKDDKYQITYTLWNETDGNRTILANCKYGEEESFRLVGDLVEKEDAIKQEADQILQKLLIDYDFLID